MVFLLEFNGGKSSIRILIHNICATMVRHIKCRKQGVSMERLGFLEKELNLKRQKGTQPTTFTGVYRGYYLVFEVNEAGGDSTNQFVLKIGATFKNQEVWFLELRNEVGSDYNTFLEKHRHIIMALGKLPQKNSEVKDFVYGLLDKVIDNLLEHGAPTGDFYKGHQEGKIEVYLVNNHYNYLSEESYKEVLEQVEEKEVKSDLKETSIQGGMSGAILGALVGAFIWIIFIYLNLPSWLGALIAIHLAFMLYRRKNGKLNVFGIALVSLSVMLSLFVANIVFDLLIGQSVLSIISMNLLVSIVVVVAYTLVFSYGVYTAANQKKGITKVE